MTPRVLVPSGVPRWTFRYPRAAVSPSPWGARLTLALHLLRPRVSWRVGGPPAALKGVPWRPSVTPLGVYRDLTGARHVRLRVPGGPAAQFRAWEGVREALLAAGLPLHPSGAVGFDVPDDLFDLGDTLLALGVPRRGTLDLTLLGREDDRSPPRAGLSLGGVPGQSSGGAPLLLLPATGDLAATLAGWQAQAAAQGWATHPPLSGDGQVLLTFTQAASTVTLTGVCWPGGAWGFTLERDTWAHLHQLASLQPL